MEFAIVRGYQSGGQVDPNAAANVRNAKAAGIQYVDLYLFPCVPCGNPAGQVQALVSAMSGVPYGMIWLDIERYQWSGNLGANQNFISSMLSELTSLGQHPGVYTNYYNWEAIVGLNWGGASGYPLWYAHYDGSPNFGDFVPFGGWSKPNIKQYAGDKTLCATGVDMNWYP